MQQERTGCLFLDIRLFYGCLVRVVRRVQRVPEVQVGIGDDDIRIVLLPKQLIVEKHIGFHVRTRLDGKINTDELAAERETQPLLVGVQRVPAVAETYPAVARMES